MRLGAPSLMLSSMKQLHDCGWRPPTKEQTMTHTTYRTANVDGFKGGPCGGARGRCLRSQAHCAGPTEPMLRRSRIGADAPSGD